jgi:MFS family permease
LKTGTRQYAPLVGLFVVSLGASLATMDLAVNVAFPSISAAFALETRSIRWVVICYVLTYSSLMLAFGKLGDRIGHRQVFRAGLVVSVLAFVLCALAPDYRSLLAARIVQGVATALVLSCAPALATLLFDESKRLSALGSYTSLTALASVLAPIIGGASIAALGWSGVFWFRAPLALLALLLLPLLPHAHETVTRTQMGAPNLAGSLLLATSLAFLLLTPALLELAASGWFALLTAVIGLAALCALAHHQRRAHDPILPLALLRDPDFVLLNLAAIIVHFVGFAVPLLVPYHLVRIAGYASFESGAVLALSPAGILIGSALAAKAAGAIGVRRTALLGGTLVAVGSLAIALWSQVPGLSMLVASLVLHGTGMGLFQVAYADIVFAALPREERGVGGSLTMVTRTIGVMSAATAMTALLHGIESRRSAEGASEAAAFAEAFATVFLYSALLLVAFFVLSGLRRSR